MRRIPPKKKDRTGECTQEEAHMVSEDIDGDN